MFHYRVRYQIKVRKRHKMPPLPSLREILYVYLSCQLKALIQGQILSDRTFSSIIYNVMSEIKTYVHITIGQLQLIADQPEVKLSNNKLFYGQSWSCIAKAFLSLFSRLICALLVWRALYLINIALNVVTIFFISKRKSSHYMSVCR